MTRWRGSRASCGRVSRARSTTSATGVRSAAASWPRRSSTPAARLPRSSGSPGRARAGRMRSILDGCAAWLGPAGQVPRGDPADGGLVSAQRSLVARARRRLEKKKGAPQGARSNVESRLGGANVIRPRSLLALLDVEADGLATAQAVEVQG